MNEWMFRISKHLGHCYCTFHYINLFVFFICLANFRFFLGVGVVGVEWPVSIWSRKVRVHMVKNGPYGQASCVEYDAKCKYWRDIKSLLKITLHIKWICEMNILGNTICTSQFERWHAPQASWYTSKSS